MRLVIQSHLRFEQCNRGQPYFVFMKLYLIHEMQEKTCELLTPRRNDTDERDCFFFFFFYEAPLTVHGEISHVPIYGGLNYCR